MKQVLAKGKKTEKLTSAKAEPLSERNKTIKELRKIIDDYQIKEFSAYPKELIKEITMSDTPAEQRNLTLEEMDQRVRDLLKAEKKKEQEKAEKLMQQRQTALQKIQAEIPDFDVNDPVAAGIYNVVQQLPGMDEETKMIKSAQSAKAMEAHYRAKFQAEQEELRRTNPQRAYGAGITSIGMGNNVERYQGPPKAKQPIDTMAEARQEAINRRANRPGFKTTA